MRHPHSLTQRSLSVSSLIAITVFAATSVGTCYASYGDSPRLTVTIEDQVLIAISRGKPAEVEALFSGPQGDANIAALKKAIHAPTAAGSDSALSSFAEQVIRGSVRHSNPALLQVLRDPRIGITSEELLAIQSPQTLVGVALEASLSQQRPTSQGVTDRDATIRKEYARQVSAAQAAIKAAETDGRGFLVPKLKGDLEKVRAQASATAPSVDTFGSVLGALKLTPRKQDYDTLLTSNTTDLSLLTDHFNTLQRQTQKETVDTFAVAQGLAAKFQARQSKDTSFIDGVAQKLGAEQKVVPSVQAAIGRIEPYRYQPAVVNDQSLRMEPPSSGGANLAVAPIVTAPVPAGGYQASREVLPKLQTVEEVHGAALSVDRVREYAKTNPQNEKPNSYENLVVKDSMTPQFSRKELLRTLDNKYINKNPTTIAGVPVSFDVVEDDTFGKVYSVTEKDIGGIWDNVTGNKIIRKTQTYYNKDGGRALVITTDGSGKILSSEQPLGDNSGSMLVTKADFMKRWGDTSGMVFQHEPGADLKPLPVPGAPAVASDALSDRHLKCISEAMKSFADVMPEDHTEVTPAFMPAQTLATLRTLPANFSSIDGREFFHDMIAKLKPKRIVFRVMDSTQAANIHEYEDAELPNGNLVIPVAMPADPKVACTFPPIKRFERLALAKGLIDAKPTELQMASAVNLNRTSGSGFAGSDLPSINPSTPIMKAIPLTPAELAESDAQEAAAALDQKK